MSILKLIASESFLTVNKIIANKLGLDAAVILAHLASINDYFEDDWFYQTYEQIEKTTTLSKHKSSKAINSLEAEGLIETKKKGVPCKKYYRFTKQTDFNFLQLINLTTVSKEIELQDGEKFNGNNNIHNDNINNDNITIVDEKFSIESDEFRLASYLKKWIIKNNELANVPTDEHMRSDKGWCSHIDKLMRIDGLTVEDVKIIIDFSQKDTFWMSNVLSTKTLRKQKDKLILKVKNQLTNNAASSFYANIENAASDSNKAWLEEEG